MEFTNEKEDELASSLQDSIRKSVTEVLILFLLHQKPMYAYEMLREIEQVTGGLFSYRTLYLAIYRLQERGYLVEKEKRIVDSRARIYLAPTESGVECLYAMIRDYHIMTSCLNRLFEQDGKLYPEEPQSTEEAQDSEV